MGSEARYPVLVSDAERAKVRTAVKRFRDKLQAERKRLVKLDVETGDVDRALSVVKGDGASGGLITRFKPRATRDMFDTAPAGQVRILKDPDPAPDPEDYEDEDAWRAATDRWEGPEEQDPADPDEWMEQDELLSHVLLHVTRDHDGRPMYVEDQDGRVWRVEVDVDVGMVEVGERPAHQVDQAVDASEEDQEDEPEPVDPEEASLRQLRRLAVRIIRQELAGAPQEDVDWAVAYAQDTVDRAWLRAWTDLANREPPEVPEEYKADQEREALGTPGGLDELDITPAAQDQAEEVGLGRDDLEGKGTGKGGRLLVRDVEDEINRRLSQGSEEAS